MSARANRGRQKSRDLLVKAVYQWQIANGAAEDLLDQYEELEEFGASDQAHFRLILESVLTRFDEFAEVVARHAERGAEQLDTVGRAVLLMGLAELAACTDVPTNVVINEAIDLAKRYAAADSYKFVNAVLDKAAREMRSAAR